MHYPITPSFLSHSLDYHHEDHHEDHVYPISRNEATRTVQQEWQFLRIELGNNSYDYGQLFYRSEWSTRVDYVVPNTPSS